MMMRINKLLIINWSSSQRKISTSAVLEGKRNFRKFIIYNKRGTRDLKEAQRTSQNPPIPINHRGIRPTGVNINGKYVEIPEKIPQLIVPNLDDCKLKPYVSYKSPDVTQSEFTSLDLFNAIYSKKIMEDYKAGKLDEDGNPKEPSAEEKLTPEEAVILARRTGSDIF